MYRNGHSAGRGRIFLVLFGRRKHPFGFIAARVGLDRTVLPRERALDLFSGTDVLHRSSDRELAIVQRLTVVNIRRAKGNAALIGNELVPRNHVDVQIE